VDRTLLVVDLDELIADIEAAAREASPQLAVRDVLDRLMASPDAVAAALPCERAELVALHVSPTVSVFKAVWAPGMAVPPHDHRMWAAIGVYAGREDNGFWRRAGGGIEGAGGKTLAAGDVGLMGSDAIHSVASPSWTGAIHVYGGDFLAQTRSMWVDGAEEQSDAARSAAIFEAANRNV
jgi:predicted metal-dependent enzyme (double-stranded beta helix superfamily)